MLCKHLILISVCYFIVNVTSYGFVFTFKQVKYKNNLLKKYCAR